jgi:hypothetical protein
MNDHEETTTIPEGCRATATVAMFAVIFLLLFPHCGRCQEHFRFNTSTVIMQDSAGRMDVGSASWPVWAHGDTLEIGIGREIRLWYGIKWIRTDGGHLYFNGPFFSAHYDPGPGGRSIVIRLDGVIRVMELYEKTTTRL